MTTHDPIALLFGGMAKLGPGDDAETLAVLRSLPRRPAGLVVDAGCGAGRQTLVLARELGVPVHALDTHGPFLRDLDRRAADAGLGELVRTHLLDMAEIPRIYRDIDLLWSEGAAYNIGFPAALAAWAPALAPGGFLVVSELAWLTDDPPAEAREFFRTGYPDMRTADENRAAAEAAGYEVLAIRTLPRRAWVDGYYDVLAPRAAALQNHPDPAVRAFAADTAREIEVFERAGRGYGYVIFALRRG